MLLGSIHHRHTSANEAYVQRYLERQMSMDSFTLQVRPAVGWGEVCAVNILWCSS